MRQLATSKQVETVGGVATLIAFGAFAYMVIVFVHWIVALCLLATMVAVGCMMSLDYSRQERKSDGEERALVLEQAADAARKRIGFQALCWGDIASWLDGLANMERAQ